MSDLMDKLADRMLNKMLGTKTGSTKKSASDKWSYAVVEGVTAQVKITTPEGVITKTYPVVKFASGNLGVLTRDGKIAKSLWRYPDHKLLKDGKEVKTI
jgi:hypothetical protein